MGEPRRGWVDKEIPYKQCPSLLIKESRKSMQVRHCMRNAEHGGVHRTHDGFMWDGSSVASATPLHGESDISGDRAAVAQEKESK